MVIKRKERQVHRLFQKTKKAMEYEDDRDTNCIVLGTVFIALENGRKELETGGRADTIQTTALLRSARILRIVLETGRDLLSLRLQWKTIS